MNILVFLIVALVGVIHLFSETYTLIQQLALIMINVFYYALISFFLILVKNEWKVETTNEGGEVLKYDTWESYNCEMR